MWTSFLFSSMQKMKCPRFPEIFNSFNGILCRMSNADNLLASLETHTMASLMIVNQVNLVTVSKRLGHAKVSTTSDIYSHAIKEADARAAEDYANAIRRKPLQEKAK